MEPGAIHGSPGCLCPSGPGQPRAARCRPPSPAPGELCPQDDGGAETADESAARALREVDDLAEFRWALAQLPARQRAVLVLRHWADLPVAEVADILGCSEGTVTSTASRAAARLAETLAHGPPPATRTHRCATMKGNT